MKIKSFKNPFNSILAHILLSHARKKILKIKYKKKKKKIQKSLKENISFEYILFFFFKETFEYILSSFFFFLFFFFFFFEEIEYILVYDFFMKIVKLNLFNHVLALFHDKFACISAIRYHVFR